MKVVISQPMYFPWVGILEQIKLADVFIHYDDVQFARGFFNRVQIKTDKGQKWLSVPLKKHHRGQGILEIEIDNSRDWRCEHLQLLQHAYRRAPHRQEMLELVDGVLSQGHSTLAQLSEASIDALCQYFNVGRSTRFMKSSELKSQGKSSQRLLDLTLEVGGSIYITGHGALKYLDHELFERSAVRVEYIDYQKRPYAQLHGAFLPYVSALDLAANCGQDGAVAICSKSLFWRDFLDGRNIKISK